MEQIKAIYPVQCGCGHIFLEKYRFNEITGKGYIGFCWCGFCRKKLMVRPSRADSKKAGTETLTVGCGSLLSYAPENQASCKVQMESVSFVNI